MAKKTIKVPAGHVALRHADPNASCTVDGVPYKMKDGHIVVPQSAVEALVSHGFYPDGTEADQEPAAEPASEAAEETAAEAEAAE